MTQRLRLSSSTACKPHRPRIAAARLTLKSPPSRKLLDQREISPDSRPSTKIKSGTDVRVGVAMGVGVRLGFVVGVDVKLGVRVTVGVGVGVSAGS